MKSIVEIFDKIAENEGITIGLLEKKLGASKGVLSRAIQNGTDIQAKWLLLLVENYPNYSADWLLSGKPPMLRDNVVSPLADEAEYIKDLKDHIATLKELVTELKKENEDLKVRLSSLI